MVTLQCLDQKANLVLRDPVDIKVNEDSMGLTVRKVMLGCQDPKVTRVTMVHVQEGLHAKGSKVNLEIQDLKANRELQDHRASEVVMDTLG